MNPTVRQDLISVLKEAEKAIAENDTAALKEASNHTIHNASIFQDENSLSMAVIIYALSKIIERGNPNTSKILAFIGELKKNLEAENYEAYKKSVKGVLLLISETDAKLKLYIEEVVMQAKIKKGSSLYYHGISLAQAAELLGISQWGLMNYIGKTSIAETAQRTDVKGRIKFARGMFQ